MLSPSWLRARKIIWPLTVIVPLTACFGLALSTVYFNYWLACNSSSDFSYVKCILGEAASAGGLLQLLVTFSYQVSQNFLGFLLYTISAGAVFECVYWIVKTRS